MRPVASSCLLVLAIAGCGSGPVPEPGGNAAPRCAAAAAQGCLVDQKSCVPAAEGPRCEPCATGQYADHDALCAPIEGQPLSHDFSEFTVQPGEEVLGLCQSWTLGNAEEIWVHAVELEQDESSHHSNWTFVPSDKFDGPDGVWPCDDRNYSQLAGATAGGVLYAQSTQAAHEVQRFPDGAAIRIPPYSRIIGDIHLLNTTSDPVTGHARLSVYDLPASEVKIKLAPFHLTYDGLNIPPHATSRFVGECGIEDSFQSALGTGVEMKLYYSLPHTHALGRRFFFEVVGGPKDGQSLIDVEGFNSEARGKAYDPAVDISGATGLRFGCEFENPRDEYVKWGFGDQEMCEMLGFADMGIGFEGRIDTAEPAGTDGAIAQFTGPCSLLGFKWDQNKPGGPPP